MGVSLAICVVLACFVVSHARNECGSYESKDLGVIFEVPPGKTLGLFNLPRFPRNLQSLLTDKCDRFAIVLASADGITVVKKLSDEYTGTIYRSIYKVLQNAQKRMKNKESLKKTKSNFANAIGNLKELVFESKEADRTRFSGSLAEELVKEKRIALLVSSTKPVDGIKLNDYVGVLHESAPPPAKPMVVLAFGVKDGQNEDLRDLTYADNRVAPSMETFSRMSSKTDDTFLRLKVLLKNPDQEKEVFGFGGLGLAGREAVKEVSDVYAETAESVENDEYCKYIADIAFLIDSSGSLKKYFYKEKHYIQRIATRYRIEEGGTHAGAVVFSDAPVGKYTNLTIRFNQYKTTKDFNNAIAKTPHYNYRTRIDLAFTIAEKELFTLKGGYRPHMKKVVFLVTDGKQNPVVDDLDKSVKLDPVKASQKLFMSGADIFCIGVGNQVNETELRRIARSPNGERVMLAKDLDELISDDFVRKSAKKSCSAVITPTTSGRIGDLGTDPTPTKDCNKCCCGGGNVYVNIFQAGSGSNYVMQGAQVTQTGNTGSVLTGTVFPRSGTEVDIRNTSKQSIDSLIKAITNSLGNNKDLGEAIKKLIGDCAKKTATTSLPTTTKFKRGGSEPDSSKRRRRSIQDEIPAQLPRFTEILKVAKLSGCNRFIQALKDYGIISDLNKQVRNNKTVTIFCPVDSALEGVKLYPSERIGKTRVRNLLRHHVALKHDSFGTMYRSLAKDGHILLQNSRQQSWKVEESNVKFSLYDGKYAEIVMVDKMLTPPFLSLKRAIKHHPNLTTFYSLLSKFNSGDLAQIMKPEEINKVCFKKNLCVGLSREMQSRITHAIQFQQFTLVAPSNRLLRHMKTNELEELGKNKEKLIEFFRKRLFLGVISKESFAHVHTRQLLQPVKSNEPISVIHQHQGGMVIASSADEAHRLVEGIRVKEGIVLVEDDME